MALEDVNADLVRARVFELVDDEGRVRIRMAPGNGDSEGIGLEFYERDGTVRLALGLNRELTSVIDLKDETGTTRARLGVESSGIPTVFSLRNGANRIMARIALHKDEAPGVTLTDLIGDSKVE